MKLEITHLAPYLPYGLKWKFDGEDFTHDIVGLDITNRGVKLVSPYNDYGDCEISSGKPLLLPMSSLYTEMEDGTVPIVELAKMAATQMLTDKGEWTLGNEYDIHGYLFRVVRNNFLLAVFYYNEKSKYFSFRTNGVELHCPQLDLFTYLFSHHYDVYSLIPQNLALDKTKIK